MLRKLVVFALIGLLVTFHFVFDLGQYFNLQTRKAQQVSIEVYRWANLVLAVAIYFTLCVLITALSRPGAALMTLAGSAVFGLVTAHIAAAGGKSRRAASAAPPAPGKESESV